MTQGQAIALLRARGLPTEPFTIRGVCGPERIDPVEELTGRLRYVPTPAYGLFQPLPPRTTSRR